MVALVVSFLINGISISGAFYGAFSLFQWFGVGKEFSGALAVVLLSLVQVGRRWAADGVWDKWFHVKRIAAGLIALNVALFIISASSSGYGIYTGILDSAPPPYSIQDTVLQKLEAEAAALQSNIDASKKTTWKGKITTDSQKAIRAYSSALVTLTDAITARRTALSSKQAATEQQHTYTVQNVALVAVGVYLCLELVFHVCMAFMSFFDWREYLLRLEQGQKSLHPTPAASTVQIDPATLAQVMANGRTGGFYPLNFVSPSFADFIDWPQTSAVPQVANDEKPMKTSPAENRETHLESGRNGETQAPQTSAVPPPQTVVFIPQNLTVEHRDRQTGKIKRLRYDQVKGNLRANVSRLEKVLSSTKTDPATVENIREQIAYWKAKVRELEAIAARAQNIKM